MADMTDDPGHGAWDGGASGDDGRRQGRPLGRRALNLAGGLVSLALLGGLAMWTWQLVVRDVSGVPVIVALEGPMRVAPKDPGGTNAAYQGLAVNEVAAIGPAAGPVDAVTLAPPPAALADEDLAPAERAPAPGEPAAADGIGDIMAGGSPDPVTPGAEDVAAADLAPPDEDAALQALVDMLSTSSTLSATAVPAVAVVPAVALGGRGVARSPRPQGRPQSATAVAYQVPIVAPAAEIDAAQIAPGTRLVQLGAYDTPEAARDAWRLIAGRADDYFSGKRRVVQQAEAGGTAFYRLRAEGFDDMADARQFCAALIARRTDCIPVEMR